MKRRCTIPTTSKRSYASENAALRAASVFSGYDSFGVGAQACNYEAYRCACGRWHLTKLRAEQRGRARTLQSGRSTAS